MVTIQHLLNDPLSDGGQWDMVANLNMVSGFVSMIKFNL